MTFVLVASRSDLLCNIGLMAYTRAQRRDRVGPIHEALLERGGPVSRRDDRLTLHLPDPTDAIIAVSELMHELADYSIELVSFVASRAAGELIAGDDGPVTGPWRALSADWEPKQPFDVRHGWGAVRHFGEAVERKALPERIAEPDLPASGLVLWDVNQRAIVHAPRTGFKMGRGSDCDYVIDTAAVSRKHVWFEQTVDEWIVHDYGSASGFYLNDERGGASQPLLPGMVLQFARPHCYVVLGAS